MLLVRSNEVNFLLELVIEVLLASCKDILSLGPGSCLWPKILGASCLIVDSQVIIEGPFELSRLVHQIETACRRRDICVSSSTVVYILDTFRVDAWQSLSGSLLLVVERPYKISYLLDLDEAKGCSEYSKLRYRGACQFVDTYQVLRS